MAKKGVKLAEKQKATRRNMVPPVNVIKLMDKHTGLGGTRAAAALGVSTTLLYKAKAEGAVNKVIEIAAAHALESFGKSLQPESAPAPAQSFGAAPRNGEAAFFVTIAADKADMFQRMAQAMGAAVVSA